MRGQAWFRSKRVIIVVWRMRGRSKRPFRAPRWGYAVVSGYDPTGVYEMTRNFPRQPGDVLFFPRRDFIWGGESESAQSIAQDVLMKMEGGAIRRRDLDHDAEGSVVVTPISPLR